MLANAWCEVEGHRRAARRCVRRRRRRARAGAEGAAHRRRRRPIAPLVARCERPLPNGAALPARLGQGHRRGAGNPKVADDDRAALPLHRARRLQRRVQLRARARRRAVPADPADERCASRAGARELAGAGAPAPAAGGAARAGVRQGRQGDRGDARSRSRSRSPENATLQRRDAGDDCKDNAGRPLANAGASRSRCATGGAPPIAKFAAAPFGIVEANADAMLPVTLRHVQGDLRAAGAAASEPARPARGRCASSACRATPTSSPGTRSVQKYHETQTHAPRSSACRDASGTPSRSRRNAKGRVGQAPRRATASARARSRCSARQPSATPPRSAAARRRRPAPVRGRRHPARRAGLPRRRDRGRCASASRCSTSARRCTCAPACSSPTSACTSSSAARTASSG